MIHILNPRERFIRRSSLLLLLIGSLGAILGAILQWFAPNPHPMDLFVPPALAVVFLVLFFLLYLKPERIEMILRTAFLFWLAAMLFPTWLFTIEAGLGSNRSLVDTLPPITSLIFPITIGMALFLSPKEARSYSLWTWVCFALPILFYFLWHPDEITTPRGRDIAITLGPVMALTFIVIRFHAGLQSTVSRLFAERSKLKNLSERDPLTGLYNRRSGQDILLRQLANDPRTGIILFDIDHFKRVNDTHGHSVGDAVIRQIVQRCAARIRKEDMFIRWGGEEFLIVLQNVSRNEPSLVANHLKEVIANTPITPTVRITASFGVTKCRSSDTVDSLLERADQALYAAKRSGRNTVMSR